MERNAEKAERSRDCMLVFLPATAHFSVVIRNSLHCPHAEPSNLNSVVQCGYEVATYLLKPCLAIFATGPSHFGP
jgi:hypothetical protein